MSATATLTQPRTNGHRRVAPRVVLIDEAEMTEQGTIKWFDRDRRFGFIIPDGGGQDVFLHRSKVTQYGIREEQLITGLPVKYKSESRPGFRPEVTAIAFA